MIGKNAARIWEHYGASDPYFGVATLERFRSDSLDAKSRAEFFASGESYVEEIWSDIRKHLDESFSPKSAVDFGCGVGRILIPLAKRCDFALGIDISQNMLDCAKTNFEEQSVSNIRLVLSDDTLSKLRGRFDVIHSFIVLQHITPSLGLRYVENLIDHLSEEGVGVLHFTYANENSRAARFRFALYRDVPFVYKLRNFVLRKTNEPLMPMFEYDLNAVLHLLQSKGCAESYIKFTDHGLKGVLIYFQKKSVAGKD